LREHEVTEAKFFFEGSAAVFDVLLRAFEYRAQV
jgi:hypothetical protein